MTAFPPDEASFRELLDARGILRAGALRLPPRKGSLLVFSQGPNVVLDMEAVKRSAERFFAAKVGLTVEKDYGGFDGPQEDAARVVLAAADAAGTRLVFGRRTTDADVVAAEAAERAQGTYGLALLAQRCPTAWLVVPEADDDPVALSIAAIFASVMLGPILAPDGETIFGVKTAREKLERPKGTPYR